jgi:hypothetical protein
VTCPLPKSSGNDGDSGPCKVRPAGLNSVFRMKQGYIKLYRKIQDHPFWSNEAACRGRAMIDLVLLTSHSSHKTQIGTNQFVLERGDFAASVRFLARRWRWGVPKTALFLDRLEADKFLVKKRNGSGNGSPSIYHIENYDLYQGEFMPERNSSQNAGGTVTEQLRNETNKGKNGEKNKTIFPDSISLREYLTSFQEIDRRTLHQTIEAISSTRKSGKVAESVLDKLASDLSRFSNNAVIKACRIYLEKNCAADGKGEKYLLGIVRGEAKRKDQETGEGHSPAIHQKTEIELAIEEAERAITQKAPLSQSEDDIWGDI